MTGRLAKAGRINSGAMVSWRAGALRCLVGRWLAVKRGGQEFADHHRAAADQKAYRASGRDVGHRRDDRVTRQRHDAGDGAEGCADEAAGHKKPVHMVVVLDGPDLLIAQLPGLGRNRCRQQPPNQDQGQTQAQDGWVATADRHADTSATIEGQERRCYAT